MNEDHTLGESLSYSSEIRGLLARTAIVVPTHWRRPHPGHKVYDLTGDRRQPNQVELLTRFLRSVQVLHDRPKLVLILISSTEPGTETDAIWQADAVRTKFPGLPIALWTPTHVRTLHGRLHELDRANWISWFDIKGYPQIRNMLLLVSFLTDCDLVVALDDDEVIEDPFFLRRAAASVVHGASNGERVYGAGGYYLDEYGSHLHEVAPASTDNPNPLERKAALMNGALHRIEQQPGEVVRTLFALGGNMTFSRDLLAHVGFDPAIARGEDIDYVINAALVGRPYHFDKHRPIRHLPPPGRSYRDDNYGKLQQDVRRFLYEREKLRVAAADGYFSSLAIADLQPYPGEMFGDTFERHAVESLRAHRPTTATSTEPSAEQFVAQALETARRAAAAFPSFAREWPAALQLMGDDRVLRHLGQRILS